MKNKEFQDLFQRISQTLTLDLISEKMEKKPGSVKADTPIWDYLDSYTGGDTILDNGKIVPEKNIGKRYLRVLFFLYISEIESRLFKIVKIKYPEIYKYQSDQLLMITMIKIWGKDHTDKAFIKSLEDLNQFRNKIMHIDITLEGFKSDKLKGYKRKVISCCDELQKYLDNIV